MNEQERALLAPEEPMPEDMAPAMEDEAVENEYAEMGLAFDPAMHHLQGEEPASPEAEDQLRRVVAHVGQFVFGDSAAKTVQLLQTRKMLSEGVSYAAFNLLKKEKMRLETSGEQPMPEVFFAETGAVVPVVDMLFEVAQHAGLPGAEDPEEYSAAIIGVYVKMGEYMEDEGDVNALSEAASLAGDVALTANGVDPNSMGGPQQRPVSQGVGQAMAERVAAEQGGQV